MTFAEKLRMLRKRKGYTQQELADIIGVTSRTLINYEMGKCCPKQTEEISESEGTDNAAKEMRKLVAKLNGLFAGGQLSEEDRDKVMYAVTDMYWKAKAGK